MWHADYLDAFHQDGSLRDIHVLDASTDAWDKFLAFAKSREFGLTYTRDSAPAPLPSSAAEALADRSCAHLLAVNLGDVAVHCHFFAADDIELDIDPREVTSRSAVEKVLNFMSELGTCLGQDVILTEENAPDYVWFRYSAREGVVRYECTV